MNQNTLSSQPNSWQQLAVRGVAIFVGLLVTVAAILIYLGSEADVLVIEADMPREVMVGEPFEVDLTVHNRTNDAQTLISVGLDHDLLEQGLTVERMVPPFRKADDLRNARWTEYTFSITLRPVVEPRAEYPLRITLVATQPGKFEGTLVIWTENRLRADYVDFEIQVRE